MADRSVGLVILTEIPFMGLVAVLRERGHFNPETMKPESWPGACQVTVHGRLKDNETFWDGLDREMEEELGNDFAKAVYLLIAKNPDCLGQLSCVQKGDKTVVTFAIKVDCSLLKKMRLAPESGAIRLVSLDETGDIADIKLFDKATGVHDRRTIAMFSDEKDAVIKAFAFAARQ